MTYYAERKNIENGTAKQPAYHTGDRDAMERQFHLDCANVLGNERMDVSVCEWGTVEQGVLERKVYRKPEEPEQAE